MHVAGTLSNQQTTSIVEVVVVVVVVVVAEADVRVYILSDGICGGPALQEDGNSSVSVRTATGRLLRGKTLFQVILCSVFYASM